MRCSLNVLVPGMALAACVVALAQAPTYKNVGRTPSQEEIRAWGISIGTEGKELPPGSGAAQQGAPIYAQKCAICHGPTGAEGPASPLVRGQGALQGGLRGWPFATTIWDYTNRAMPLNQGGSLSAEEVYALTAFLLYRNGIIQESDVLDTKSLPKIQMPDRNNFIPPRLEDIHDPRKRGCRLGLCP